MAKQIEGQLSFDFMETFDTKEISMDDYMNRPENMDTTEVEPVKRKQTSKTRKKTKKNTTENSPVKEILCKNQKPNTFIDSNAVHSILKPASDYMEHDQQAVEHVTEHRGITIGTIMRLYRLSAVNASEIFQRLIENKVIDESGRFYKEKKEL